MVQSPQPRVMTAIKGCGCGQTKGDFFSVMPLACRGLAPMRETSSEPLTGTPTLRAVAIMKGAKTTVGSERAWLLGSLRAWGRGQGGALQDLLETAVMDTALLTWVEGGDTTE